MSQTRRIVYPDADPTTVDLLKGPLWDRLEALGTALRSLRRVCYRFAPATYLTRGAYRAVKSFPKKSAVPLAQTKSTSQLKDFGS